ncbi:RNA-binding protein [Ignicoccus islandicus DSM 13165]|uniref:RNA-binding protein n=1 Tax=Ignicoccus islandicus DSM 13165 TaxID=940295 RepID=A0A0U3G112_9CREN|nr:DUF402 domain-containing protein [Ignicoccus islandicus]ALU11996.1 RNA-binding protein [Ignicoccus islandicus DSM 13165]
MSIRVRVRGIYATSIAKILLDKGFELSDVSDKLKERLGGYEGSPEPPHVTVKTSDASPHHLIVNGFYEESKDVFEALEEIITTSPRYIARPNLHAAYKVAVDENCLTEVEGINARVRTENCYSGRVLLAEVVKSKVLPKDEVLMEEGVRVQGFYSELMWGKRPGVSFSKHIPDSLKPDLMMVARDLVQLGFRVHWRSSARKASLTDLRLELEELRSKLEEVLERAKDAKVGELIYKGEFLGLYNLILEDKFKLDEIRRKVLPTMPFHHSLKAEKSLTTAVDLGDKLSRDWNEDTVKVKEFVLEKAAECRSFVIEHEKLNGDVIRLGPFKIMMIDNDKLVLYREIRTEGKYDGLNVRKEKGDRVITILEPGSNYVIHAYFSPNWELKGMYLNLNSGVEVLGCKARYVDLEVDLVRDFLVRIVDEKELEKYSEHLPLNLKELVERLKDELVKVLSSDELERKLKGYAFSQ